MTTPARLGSEPYASKYLKRSTLSIDDFGTGYASLSYLKDFPVDAVKIDRTCVDGLGTEARHSALVAAILAMADALGLAVTAEGTPTQLAILKRLRCHRAQGYLLSRPVPAEAVDGLLEHCWNVDQPIAS